MNKLVVFVVFVLASVSEAQVRSPEYWASLPVAKELKLRFISPLEVGEVYTDAELETLAKTIPSETGWGRTIWWLNQNDYVLIPTPSKPRSVSEMRGLPGGDAEDRTTFGWLAVKRNPFKGSLGKPWEKQVPLLSEKNERVPNAAEVFYVLLKYNKVRGEKLMSGKCVNTSTETESFEKEGRKRRRTVVCFWSDQEPLVYSSDLKEDLRVGVATAGKR